MKIVRRFFESLTCDQVNKITAAILALFLLGGGILYWQGELGIGGLVFFAFFALMSGILLLFHNRLVQRDGFLDGYSRAKNDFNKKKQ